MEQKVLLYKHSQISYYCYGQGARVALCFHGYGEDARSFSFLGKYDPGYYRYYCIDLPYHGNTVWKEGLNFTHTDLRQIIDAILQKEKVQSLEQQKISLLGYSLGGRIALSLYQSMPAHIEKIVLLAPDGLKVNGWYWLATQTVAGNRLFSLTMKRPQWFFGLLKMLNKLKLVNASIYKFVNFYIGDGEVRQLLYDRWTTLRRLKPNLQKIKTSIKKFNTPVHLMYGRHDRIILSVVGEKFKKGIEAQCSITVIAAGHQVLHEKYAGEILHLLHQ